MATIISSLCLGGCTVGLPDGSALDITYVPNPGEVIDGSKPHIDLTTAIAGLVGSPIAGALLYQYGLRPMRKRRKEKREKQNGA